MISSRNIFINLGHAYDHLFMLLYPTVVLTLETEMGRSYGDLLALAIPGFIAFAAGALPAGWLGDRWSRPGMLAVFFFGIGAASILTGFARTPFQLAAGLALIGLFASIYHPVGIAMLVEGRDKVGKLLGINGVAGNLGLGAAALIAVVLTDLISWRAAFMVPGAVALATGLVYLRYARRWPRSPRAAAPRARLPRGEARRTLLRLVLVLAVATLLTGLVFQSSTIALPKLFDDGLRGLAESSLGVGGLVSLIITLAAFTQIGVGWLIDKYPVKPIWIAMLFAQVPLLLLAGASASYGLLAVSLAMMIVIIGEIPVQDALIARYTADAWRSRVYGVKFLVALGASALALPLVALMHDPGFVWLFALLGLCAGIVGVVAFWLPGARRDATPVPASDHA